MPLITEQEAARHIGMSVAFLRADRYRGHVGNCTPRPPFYRLGKSVRYDVVDLDRWLAERRVDRSSAQTTPG